MYATAAIIADTTKVAQHLPLWHAVILGITQGLSEFLPISSSGHLILVRWLLGFNDLSPHLDKTFDVALHLGTLVGAVAYFWSDLVSYVRDGIPWLVPARRAELSAERQRNGRVAWLLIISAIPAAIVGALFESAVDEHAGKVWLIGIMLIVFGLVLFAADRLSGQLEERDFDSRGAVGMGVAQALALQPGVSRSGVTMSAGRALGFSRDGAVRLSFLMSLPIIAGAVVFKGAGVVKDGLPSGMGSPFLIGIVTSAITGYIAVWGTLKIIRTRSFTPFVVYRIVAGVIVLGLFAAGFHSAAMP